MYKDLIKKFVKKNMVSIIAIAVVLAIIIIKFAIPFILTLGIVILCIAGLYFFKRKVQVQVGGNNSRQVQCSSDENTIQVQDAGDNSKQTQIYND